MGFSPIYFTVVYVDYTASGRPLKFIEDYILKYVSALYANTHTTTSFTARQTTHYRHEARCDKPFNDVTFAI